MPATALSTDQNRFRRLSAAEAANLKPDDTVYRDSRGSESGRVIKADPKGDGTGVEYLIPGFGQAYRLVRDGESFGLYVEDT